MPGPLSNLRVLEIAGIGPGPFAAMVLADLGADVLRVDRIPGSRADPIEIMRPDVTDVLNRGRPSVGVDLAHPDGRELVLTLAGAADALLEGFRPGVMERLRLGPEDLAAVNPGLVYVRVTGYGQSGPLAGAPGHDINYIALSGALGAIAREGQRPLFPLNLLGDFAGGGLLSALGLVCGILEARQSGVGQVVDCAMLDGAALLTSMIHGLRARGRWHDRPGTNVNDSGAHFYEVYGTSDGRHVAVGAVEPRFYATLLARLGLDPDDWPQWDEARWPELRGRLAAIFARRPAEHWRQLLEGTDACASVVLLPHEAPEHPHNQARQSFVEICGVTQPAPAPRFSRTPGSIDRPPSERAANTATALAAWGVEESAIAALRASGAIAR